VARRPARGGAGRALTPVLTVLAAGAAAAVASCWPVVFSGRSFVSPLNGGVAELYEHPPFVPDPRPFGQDHAVRDVHGSDTAAMAWAYVPYTIVQYRAVIRDREVPLWNRYNACGVPLLGQGLSMLGDPLQWLPILARGAAWAFDARFVIAKALWCTGIGCLVLLATGHAPATILVAASSAWIGFFSFRLNHPGFFTLGYAPWILVCWLGLARAATRRAEAGWIAAGACATWLVMSTGAVKEAVMQIASLHLTGALAWWLTPLPAGRRRRTAWRLLAGGIGTVALTAPLWATFAEALSHAHTASDAPFASWTPLSLLPGLFDDIFSRAFNPRGDVNAPSANGLYLAGVLWWMATRAGSGAVRLGAPGRDAAARAALLGAIPTFILTFGLLPANDILSVPFLRNVIALDNAGGCVLLVHAAVIAGAGLAACWRTAGARRWMRDWAVVTALLLGLIGVHLVLSDAVHQALAAMAAERADVPMNHDAAFWRQVGPLTAAVALLPLAWRAVARPSTRTAGFAGLLAVAVAIHWRHGMMLTAGGGWPVEVLGPRMDVRLTSPALVRLRPDPGRPLRVVGLGRSFFPGYSGIHAIEGVGGPDAVQDLRYRELLLAAGLDPIWSWWYRIRREEAPRARPLLDLLNVGWYAGRADGPSQPRVAGLVRAGRLDLDLWRSPTVWPRAFFCDAVRPCDSAQAFMAMVRAGDGRPFAAVDPLEWQTMPVPRGAARRIVAARDYVLTANTTTVTVDAPGPGVLVLTECWAGGDVTAEQNGRPAPVLRANHAFRAVVIPAAGTATIVFRYRPRSLAWSVGAAGLAAALLAGLVAVQ